MPCIHCPSSSESVNIYIVRVLRQWRGASTKTAVSRTSQSMHSRSERARNGSGVHSAHQSTVTSGFVPWVPVSWYSECIPDYPEGTREEGRPLCQKQSSCRDRRARAPALREQARWRSLCLTTSFLTLFPHPLPFPALQVQGKLR